MKKYIANIITGCRVFCSILLLLFPVPSVGFYTSYIACGVSDMLDGAAARMTGSTSESGAIFDTVADLIFTAVSIVKLMPLIQLPGWLWIWAAIIAIIKTGNIVRGLICKKKPVSLHTVPNKITGFMLFLLPFTMRIVEVEFAAAAVCAAATFAAIQEWYYIAVGHEMV